MADREFNELVNMTADELESWLKEEQSQESGWAKDDGSGETVGHERYNSRWNYSLFLSKTNEVRISGRKIIEILKKNPSRDPDQYDQEDVAHMRKVVAVFIAKVTCIKNPEFTNCRPSITNAIWLKKKKPSKIRIARATNL